MESLRTSQVAFTLDVARLIQFIYAQGYEVTLGEAYRTQEQAELYAQRGIGIKDSLHCKRLAIDLQLFRDGRYLIDSKDYYFAGLYWESLSPYNRWGGFFVKNKLPAPDGNHFQRNLP